jgi:hypothetical protein
MGARPAAGGGRWVEVEPARLQRWLDGFAQRHGVPAVTPGEGDFTLTAPDGATASLYVPPGTPGSMDDVADLVAAVQVPRRIGLLLARQASVAVGLADGGVLKSSKVDSSYVQGRTAAGGWSQQRFARRRENQAKAAAGSAAEIVARLLLPEATSLDALVTGGDRRAVDAVLSDPRFAPLVARRAERFLDVPEPRLSVLEAAVARARTTLIKIREAPPDT